MAFFTKRYHPPGTAPGMLGEQRLPAAMPAQVRLVQYDSADLTMHEAVDAMPAPSEERGIAWLHVQGHPSQELLARLGDRYGIHPLALEDIHNTGQRPKVEEFEHQLFVILALPRFVDGCVEVYQASFLFAAQTVLSFCTAPVDPFLPVLRRLQERAGLFRGRGADYLLYALLDAVVDGGFPVLEAFGVEFEALEEKILVRAGREALPHIHRVKRELILLRRMLWPQRDVLNALVREEREQIREGTRIFLRDCYDHTVQVMDLVETYRDMSVSMLDIYLTSVSNRMNEIMRVLTMIATIFIPLTFIVGVYGMNFGTTGTPKSPWAMPELDWYYGYPLVWLLMVMVALGMLLYFRRKHWL